MTNAQRDLPIYDSPGTTHIDHAAAVTVRMPSPDECASGYPAGAPVLVIDRGSRGKLVLPHNITVTFDDPHPKPIPHAAGDAAAYILPANARHWRRAGAVLGDDGELLRLYDEHLAAPASPAAPLAAVRPAPLLPVSITVTVDGVVITWPDGTKTTARPPRGAPER